MKESYAIKAKKKPKLTIEEEYESLMYDIKHTILTDIQEHELSFNPFKYLTDRLGSSHRAEDLFTVIVNSYFQSAIASRTAALNPTKSIIDKARKMLQDDIQKDSSKLSSVELSQIIKNLS